MCIIVFRQKNASSPSLPFFHRITQHEVGEGTTTVADNWILDTWMQKLHWLMRSHQAWLGDASPGDQPAGTN